MYIILYSILSSIKKKNINVTQQGKPWHIAVFFVIYPNKQGVPQGGYGMHVASPNINKSKGDRMQKEPS